MSSNNDDAAVVSVSWKPPAMPDSDPLVAMIERVSRDPSVDIERLERLLAQREKAVAEYARAAWNDAMARAQADMEPVRKDADNPQTRSKYASYPALDNAIRPIYSRHGFSLTFDTGETPLPEHVRVLLFVARGLHERMYHLDIPIVTQGFKGTSMMTLTHATLSAVTYGRRGLLSMAFNIATTNDDDGNAAGRAAPITAEQVQELQLLIVTAGADIKRFCRYLQVARLEELPADRLAFAKSELQRKIETDGGTQEQQHADHPARDA